MSGEPPEPPRGAPVTIRVSSAELLIAAVIATAAIAGYLWLPRLLELDLACMDAGHGRRARFAVLVGCAFSAGPRGWIYLGWLAAPVVLFGHWLRTRLAGARQRL